MNLKKYNFKNYNFKNYINLIKYIYSPKHLKYFNLVLILIILYFIFFGNINLINIEKNAKINIESLRCQYDDGEAVKTPDSSNNQAASSITSKILSSNSGLTGECK